MKQCKLYLAIIVLILLSVSCRVNKCLQQSDKNITNNLLQKEVFVLNTTAELLMEIGALLKRKSRRKGKRHHTLDIQYIIILISVFL